MHKLLLVFLSFLLVSGALPVCGQGPQFLVDYADSRIPCYASSPMAPEAHRITTFSFTPVAAAVVTNTCYVEHGWGTLCWESFAGMDAQQIAGFVVQSAVFALEIDGENVQPSYLVIETSDCSTSSPSYCCGGAEAGDWGWGIRWGFEFPPGDLQVGIHLVKGTWAWTGPEVRCGPFPEMILPFSGDHTTTLTMLPE